MRKAVILLMSILLLAGLACPVLAADFVPSITYKPVPEITDVELIFPDGTRDPLSGCIVVTSILEAQEKTTDITQKDRDLLLEVYEKLSDGSMDLFAMPRDVLEKTENSDEPTYKDMGLGFEDRNFAVIQLVDVNFVQHGCVLPAHLHKENLAREKVVIELDFDLGVKPDAVVEVLWFDGEQWAPVESTVNNGDGTVTCVFEDFCPVAFCVEAEARQAPAQPEFNWLLWLLLLLACAVAIAVLVILREKNKNNRTEE